MKVDFSTYQTDFYVRLSIKAMNEVAWELCPHEFLPNCITLDSTYGVQNPRTAQIKREELVKILAGIYEKKPFNRLEFLSHYYEGTAQEIFKLVKDNLESKNQTTYI